MELVKCDLCGSSSATAVARQTDVIHGTTDEYFAIVRCDVCGLCFTNPRPDVQQIGSYYAKEYPFFQRASPLLRIARRVLLRIANSPVSVVSALIPALSRRIAVRVLPRVKDPVWQALKDGVKGGLLDIGCGSGDHANFWGHSGALMAYRRAIPVAGVEISADARKFLESFNIESWATIDAVPRGRQWPIIRLNWSLEHVHQPSLFFQFIADHLSSGGRAIITVPNYDGLLYRLARDCVELPIHLYHFSVRDMEGYAAKYGLRIRRYETFSYPGMFFTATDLGLLTPKFGGNFGILEARRFQKTLSRFDRAGFGNDMVVEFEHARAD